MAGIKASCNQCARHNDHCPDCLIQENKRTARNTKAKQRRKEREDIYRSLGLTRGKTSGGKTIWE